jgi:hypothetical protein
MGLLDDAIREHLELKRRTGADPEDLERQEREALGPVVRGDELATDIASGEADGVSSEYEPLGDDLVDAYDHEFDPFAEPAPEPHPQEQAEPKVAPEADRGPAEEQLEVEPDAPPHAGQPTEEFDVEAAHAEEERREPEPSDVEHDVLEETPDFLQETPEHDRLWFEQAPPQDFDFDK